MVTEKRESRANSPTFSVRRHWDPYHHLRFGVHSDSLPHLRACGCEERLQLLELSIPLQLHAHRDSQLGYAGAVVTVEPSDLVPNEPEAAHRKFRSELPPLQCKLIPRPEK